MSTFRNDEVMCDRSTCINQAVVLAGGKGIRLRPITNRLPKPLAPVRGVPFLDYLFQSLVEVGISKILMLLGYKYEMIMHRYGDSLPNGIKIEYSVGDVDDRTGRRLLNAYSLLDEHFLLMYGDNYWPIALTEMKEVYDKTDGAVLTTVFSNTHGTGEYGFENNIGVGEDLFVRNYDKSRRSEGLNGIDIGFFLVQKNTLDPDMEGNLSFEEDCFADLVRKRQVVAYVTDTQYYYITDIESLRAFEKFVKRHNVQHISL